MVARWAHNPKVVGSSPASATKRTSEQIRCPYFLSTKKRNRQTSRAAYKEREGQRKNLRSKIGSTKKSEGFIVRHKF